MKVGQVRVRLIHSSHKLIILGLLIRLVPAAFTAHPTDMQSWRTIGSALYSGLNPYTLPAYGLVYPPLWGFICLMAYAVYAQAQNAFIFNFLIKLPIIAADIAIAKTIEKIVQTKTKDQKIAQKTMILYLFNPVTIIMSSILGMFDSIPVFLVLGSIIFLAKRQYVKSSVLLSIAIAFKGIYPALLLPLLLYRITKIENKQKTLKYLAFSMLVPAIFSAPFLIGNATAYINLTINHYAQRQISNLTYWLVIRSVFPQNQELVSTIGFVTFIVAFLAIYATILRKADMETVTKTMTQIILAFYLTSPTVNEQYLIWLLPPMLIYSTAKKQMKTFVYALTIATTTYAIANVGTSFLLPINSQLGQIQHIWPIMVVCSLIFPIVSALTLQSTTRESKRTRVGINL